MPTSSSPLNQRIKALPCELGQGLVMRQATKDDVDSAVSFTERIHDSYTLGVSVRDLMEGAHPTTSAADFVLVIDNEANNIIVAMAGLISQTWAYDGISFEIGNPEMVATDPAYRQRGLIRAVMEGLHFISTSRGHLAQAILGVRWFYRKFDYEYALTPGEVRHFDLRDVPLLSSTRELYHIQRITKSELSLIKSLYQQQSRHNLVTTALDEAIRQHDISGYSEDSDLGDWTFVILNEGRKFVGYFSTWGDPWGVFTVKEFAVVQNEAYDQIVPSLLRFIKAQLIEFASIFEENEPAQINFELCTNHPAYSVLGKRLSQPEPRQDWYLRVPDLPKFIRRIASVLEKRLAGSNLHDFSGDLNLTFFKGGLQLRFDHGILIEASDWNAPEESGFTGTGFPPLIFLKLLFGYRSLAELRYAYPDCWASERDSQLLNILFPKQRSWIRQL